MTTKRGDVVIYSVGDHYGKCRALDFLTDGASTQKEIEFIARKLDIMSKNGDSIKNRLMPRNQGPRSR